MEVVYEKGNTVLKNADTADSVFGLTKPAIILIRVLHSGKH